MKNKYFEGTKLIENKSVYPFLYSFLTSKNINISNIFIVDMPAFNLYYVENEQRMSKNVSVLDVITDDLDFSIFKNNEYQIFIFPTEDIYDNDMKSITYKYNERLRIYYELSNWGEKVLLRKNKLKRLYG
jgi:hypothetical protein